GVAVEADQRSVRTAHALGGPHDYGSHDLPLLHAAARNGFLHGHDDGVADARVLPLGAAQHLDALHTTGAGIVGHVKVGFHLDHRNSPFGSRLKLRPRPVPLGWTAAVRSAPARTRAQSPAPDVTNSRFQ